MPIKTYRVYTALHEDAKEGWIWLSPSKDVFSAFVRIRNRQNGKSIICERRTIDSNFRAIYNSRPQTVKLPDPDPGDLIVMSDAFRTRLGGIPTQAQVPFEVTNITGWCGWWRRNVTAFWDHPNPAIRLGIRLGLISVILGILGLMLGILGLVLGLISLLN